eukprot:9906206-Alexandrium_andersonii.AAC.1
MYPDTSRASDRVEFALCQFYGRRKRGRIHTDGAIEYRRAARDMFLPHSTSAPGRSETNAIAERNVQSLATCVRALLEQSGLEQAFWPYAARAAAHALNTR